MQRLKMLLFFKRQGQKQQEDSKEIKTYKSLLSQSVKSIDIYQIQQELLKIRIMIRLIFTAEQYAAIQLCGCSIDNIEKEIKLKNKTESKILLQQQQIKEPELSLQETKQNVILTETNEIDKLQIDRESKLLTPINNIKEKNFQRSKEKICLIPENGDELIQNPLEIIEQIENNQDLLKHYIDKFLSDNIIPQSELDKRILQSMIEINKIEDSEKL